MVIHFEYIEANNAQCLEYSLCVIEQINQAQQAYFIISK